MNGLRIRLAVPVGLLLIWSCGRCWAEATPQVESRGADMLFWTAQPSSAVLEQQTSRLWNQHLEAEEQRPSAWLQHCLQVLVDAFPDTEDETQDGQGHRAAVVCGVLEAPWCVGCGSGVGLGKDPRPVVPPPSPTAHRRSFRSVVPPAAAAPAVLLSSGTSWATFDNDRDVLSLVGACCCVLCAAIAAGLTIGLMSIDPLELEIKQRVGTVSEKAHACRVLPLITRHHVLLVTLLLYNAMANEALPIFFDDLMPTPYAVGLSVTMVLLFGEILPSALFSGPSQLRIASNLSGLVWCLIYLLAPLAMPLAWLLDKLVGPHNHRKRYTRAELSALIEIHQEAKQHRRRQHHTSHMARQPSHNGTTFNSANANGGWSQLSEPLLTGSSTSTSTALAEAGGGAGGGLYTSLRRGGGGPLSPSNGNGNNSNTLHDAPPGSMLSQDEVDIVLGVLKIASKTVQNCMVPMTQVFSLSTDEVLSEETLALVMASGYSRIPVFQGGDVTHLRGFLLVKRLIVLDPKARRHVGSVSLRQPLVVSPHFPLIDLLNTFQEGRSHLAVVAEAPQLAIDCMVNGQPLHGDATPLGIITLEDVIEEILQEEILDEHDRGRQFQQQDSTHYYHNHNNNTNRLGGAKQLLSASLLRKCPVNGGCEEEGGGGIGVLQQVAVDLAVVQHTHSNNTNTSTRDDSNGNGNGNGNGGIGIGISFPPPGLVSPSQRFKRLSMSQSSSMSMSSSMSPHKTHTTRPRSASNSASSPSPSSSSPLIKPRRVSLTTCPLPLPLPLPPSHLQRSESAPYAPDPPPPLVTRSSSDPSGSGTGVMPLSQPPAPAPAPPSSSVGPISSMLLPPQPQPPSSSPYQAASAARRGRGDTHQGEGEGEGEEGGGDDKPILRSNPYF